MAARRALITGIGGQDGSLLAELLLEQGYEGVTMQGVAQRAGVSTATLYRRYANKVDLMVSALETQKDVCVDVDTGSFEGDLRAMGYDAVEVFNGRLGRVMKALIGEMQRNTELMEEMRQRLFEGRMDEAAAVIDRAVARGEIPPLEEPQIALQMLHGILTVRLFLEVGPIDRDLIDRMMPLALAVFGVPRGSGEQPGDGDLGAPERR
jgi:AcrR family transcriptional regulator